MNFASKLVDAGLTLVLSGLVALFAVGCGGSSSTLCFDSQTLVATPSGPRAIGTLEPGDVVIGAEGNEVQVASLPTWEYDGPLVELRVNGGAALVVTPDHMMPTPKGVARADMLEVGTVVYVHDSATGEFVERPLVSVSSRPANGVVVNLVVPGGHVVAATVLTTALHTASD